MLRPGKFGRGLAGIVLLSPVLSLYCTVYLGGLVLVALTSVGLATTHITTDGPTLGYYYAALRSPELIPVAERTLRVSLATVFASLVCGYPVARYITSASGRWKTVVLMCVLSPILVSSIGRIFGWVSLIGPGSAVAFLSTKFFNMKTTGFLYTEFAMVIGMTNLLLPFMVLSIAASRTHLDPDLMKAAASLGAQPRAAFWQVELPLSLPGILSGMLTVFALSISNFITAALLGGPGNDVLAYEIYLDVLVYFQQARGSALAVLLLVSVIILIALAIGLSSRNAAAQTAKQRTSIT